MLLLLIGTKTQARQKDDLQISSVTELLASHSYDKTVCFLSKNLFFNQFLTGSSYNFKQA